MYFVKYVVFCVSAFWIQIDLFGLKLDALVKVGKNVEIEYANPQKHIIAAKESSKRRLVTIDLPVRLVHEQNKQEKERRKKTRKQ